MEKIRHPHVTDVYASFFFLKLNPAFRMLMSNERITAKQEFENAVAVCQDKIFLRTYSLMGLRSECDMLFWRISPDLDGLQESSARMFSAGVGKHLIATHSFLGTYHLPDSAARRETECGCVPKGLFGRFRFLLLHPVLRSHTWYELSEAERQRLMAERSTVLARHPGVQEHFFSSYGLDDHELIVVREAEKLADLASASRELREQRIKNFSRCDTPVMLCIGRDLRDIMDALG
ncbi:MAG: chlorite dismutase family protein [bacterium]